MNDKQHIGVEVQEGVYIRQPLDYVDTKTTHTETKHKENYTVERITHVHANWLVAALLIGMVIGFVFGVVR
jgi:hypothetical protein